MLERRADDTPAGSAAREMRCGNCGFEFVQRLPRTGELLHRDSDFCPHYRGPNTVLYRVTVCPSCHFAAYKDHFSQLEDDARDAVRDALGTVGLGMAADFAGSERTLFAALRSYQLALVCYAARRFPPVTFGSLSIRAAWICRYAGELGREQEYLEQAMRHYRDAFERGTRHDDQFDDLAIAYLVAELLRRTGSPAEARGYLEIVLRAPDTRPYLRELAQDRVSDCKESERILACLRQVHAFKPLNSRSLALLAAHSTLRRFPAGSLVYRKGDPGNSMFVVASGTVAVHLGDPAGSDAVAVLGPSDTFGELSLFTGAARGAAVIAGNGGDPDGRREGGYGGAELVEISLPAFRYLVKAEPRVAEQVALDLARRQARYAQLALELLAEERSHHKPGSSGAASDLVDRIRSLISLPESFIGPGTQREA